MSVCESYFGFRRQKINGDICLGQPKERIKDEHSCWLRAFLLDESAELLSRIQD